MTYSLKSLLSLSLVILPGLLLSCDATAAQSRDQVRTSRQIQACLDEISRHADYDAAIKVVHWVASLEQRNRVELRIVVNTTVVLEAAARPREYRASCVTDTLGGIVDFRLESTQVSSEHNRGDAPS